MCAPIRPARQRLGGTGTNVGIDGAYGLCPRHLQLPEPTQTNLGANQPGVRSWTTVIGPPRDEHFALWQPWRETRVASTAVSWPIKPCRIRQPHTHPSSSDTTGIGASPGLLGPLGRTPKSCPADANFDPTFRSHTGGCKHLATVHTRVDTYTTKMMHLSLHAAVKN